MRWFIWFVLLFLGIADIDERMAALRPPPMPLTIDAIVRPVLSPLPPPAPLDPPRGMP
ncbi:MAG TPA: hypothetical protein VM733_04575 [Thermoanaerobaculia bacterium]|nr:hypothetical protein [Thermoanaerobaculia bacterium]